MTDLIERLRTTPTERTWDSVGRPYDYPKHLPLEAADRIEVLERENAELRAKLANSRREALEEAEAICNRQARYFRELSVDPKCLRDIRWDSQEEARHTMQSYAERHECDAAAILALSDSTPTPLQEQNANMGKEEG